MTEQSSPEPAAYDFDRIRKDLVQKLGSLETVNVALEQKKKELAGFITDNGALLLLASLQGIDTAPSTEPSEKPEDLSTTTLEACKTLKEGAYVHVKGVIVDMSKLREATRKDGSKTNYKVCKFSDTTDQVTLMLWGSDISKYEDLLGRPIIIENAKIRFYQERLQVRLTNKSHIHRVATQGTLTK